MRSYDENERWGLGRKLGFTAVTLLCGVLGYCLVGDVAAAIIGLFIGALLSSATFDPNFTKSDIELRAQSMPKPPRSLGDSARHKGCNCAGRSKSE